MFQAAKKRNRTDCFKVQSDLFFSRVNIVKQISRSVSLACSAILSERCTSPSPSASIIYYLPCSFLVSCTGWICRVRLHQALVVNCFSMGMLACHGTIVWCWRQDRQYLMKSSSNIGEKEEERGTFFRVHVLCYRGTTERLKTYTRRSLMWKINSLFCSFQILLYSRRLMSVKRIKEEQSERGEGSFSFGMGRIKMPTTAFSTLSTAKSCLSFKWNRTRWACFPRLQNTHTHT